MAMEGAQQLLIEAFEDGSGGLPIRHLAVARETQHHAGSIAYLTAQRGLEPDRAVALALLLSLCSASLARAQRTHDAAFAASAHLVAASMRWLALTSPPAPRVYANLHGECARHPATAPPRHRATPPPRLRAHTHIAHTLRRAPGSLCPPCHVATRVEWCAVRCGCRRAGDRGPRVAGPRGGRGPTGQPRRRRWWWWWRRRR